MRPSRTFDPPSPASHGAPHTNKAPHHRRKGPLKAPRSRKKRFFFAVLWVLTALFTVALAMGAVLILPYTKEEMDPGLLDLPAVNRPALLYAYDPAERADRAGELQPAPGAPLSPPERRIYVPIEEMPADLIHAFVAIEDKRFYEHHGVDLIRTMRAAMGYLGGHPTCGGSTITQQLIKNLTGEDAPTADRKLTEIFRALDLERKASKEDVLECYLNIINLAEGCRGVGAAAACYFSKSTAELTLPECAAIAAITQNPARYDPLRHPAAARERRNLILTQMAAQGYITEAVCAEAIATELILAPGDLSGKSSGSGEASSDGETITSWYADMVVSDVIRDLTLRLGYTRARASDLVYTGGLVIETAMDVDLQVAVESYYGDLAHFPVGDADRPQSSFILIDPYTGDILAVAGAVGEKQGNRLQNYATDTLRPAGSCIKPLSLYAPAIEEGLITWATILEDEPVSEINGTPWPRNADGLYRGRVTVGLSVAESINTVAVRLLDLVGEEASLQYLRERFGFTTLHTPDESASHDQTISSLALGQQSCGVTSRELTAAYTAFFDGYRKSPVSYHRVLDRDGHVLLENKASQRTHAISPSTASLMTRLLESVTDSGTAARYITLTETHGIATAGKTGTTQNNCDRRFVGYTPRLLAGVWMGYDYPAELRGIGGNPCVRIWDDLMTICEEIYKGAPPQNDFALPTPLIGADFCPLSGRIPNDFCTDPMQGMPTERGWFIPGTEPHEICGMHKEPEIVIIPSDPADPDRIPLLPGDFVSPDDPVSDHTPPALLPDADKRRPEPSRPWFSRWFSRHAQP